MRTISLVALAVLLLAATAGPLAGGARAEEARKEISGTVEKADATAGRVVVDGQTYLMPTGTAGSLKPKAGDKIAFTYEEQGGKKVITSFRQGAKQ